MSETTFKCEICFDTETIDQGGREIACPGCQGDYHPRAVTVRTNPNFGESFWERRYQVIDRSQGAAYVYFSSDSMDEAQAARRKRQGVIKAALTRRANKARKG